ncbi:DUF397 domain-containing protein [Streptomyces sp. NPDC058694]|uniref:DUF397 domain-containing protein n=1 Tax=Streptomyces sp. NPDC058694 TaxID=3346603 RepID=UPI003661F6D1
MPESQWIKSSFSEASGNNCVEVAARRDGIALRESDSPTTVLRTSASALSALLRSTQTGPPARSPE